MRERNLGNRLLSGETLVYRKAEGLHMAQLRVNRLLLVNRRRFPGSWKAAKTVVSAKDSSADGI
jgi:hypothetical protein